MVVQGVRRSYSGQSLRDCIPEQGYGANHDSVPSEDGRLSCKHSTLSMGAEGESRSAGLVKWCTISVNLPSLFSEKQPARLVLRYAHR